MTQQDMEQRLAEAQWAIGQCLKAGIDPRAIAILAHECGFNVTDVRLLTEFMEEA
jgi:hypothetical protein